MRRGTEAAEKMGVYLREKREEKFLSINALARQMGVPAATVSQIEKAHRALKLDKIPRYARALGIHEEELLAVWRLHDEIPAEPITRRRTKSKTYSSVEDILKELTATERVQVFGYIEGVIESRP